MKTNTQITYKSPKTPDYLEDLLQMGWAEIERYELNQKRKHRKIKSCPTIKSYHTA